MCGHPAGKTPAHRTERRFWGLSRQREVSWQGETETERERERERERDCEGDSRVFFSMVV